MNHLNDLLLFALFFLVASVASVEQNLAVAQSNSWDDAFVSPHTILTVNLNASRAIKSVKSGEIRDKIQGLIKKKTGLELFEIDRFQFSISNPPNIKNADDTFYTQLTLAEPREFNAESVGRMSGYKLTKTNMGGQVAFIGAPERAGAWGGMVINERTLLFAVKRKMDALVRTQKLEKPAEHKLKTLRAVDADICITLSGGDKTNSIFKSAWNSNHLAKLFSLYQSGLIYLDSQSDQPLVVELTCNDQANTGKLKLEIKRLANEIKSNFDKLSQQFYEYGPLKGTKGYETFIKEADRKSGIVAELSKFFTTLEFRVDGGILRITSKQKAVRRLPETLFNFLELGLF